MKKILTLSVLFLVLFAINTSATWNSGWKYVNSIEYNYNEQGKLNEVQIFLSDYIGGDNTFVVCILNSDILTNASLKHLVSQAERCRNNNLKVHFRNSSRNDSGSFHYIYAGNKFRFNG